jgi:hypothetical protein
MPDHATELAALCACIAVLEAVPPAAPVLLPMFADREHVDRTRAAITDVKDGDKKPTLPNVIPSFKANALNIRKPPLPSFSFPLPLPLLLYFIYSFSSFKAFLISRKVSLFGAELYRLKPSFVIHSSTERQAWPFHLGSSSETHHFVHFFCDFIGLSHLADRPILLVFSHPAESGRGL